MVVQLNLSSSDTTAIEICESCGLVRANVANSDLSDTSGDVQNYIHTLRRQQGRKHLVFTTRKAAW